MRDGREGEEGDEGKSPHTTNNIRIRACFVSSILIRGISSTQLANIFSFQYLQMNTNQSSKQASLTFPNIKPLIPHRVYAPGALYTSGADLVP